MKQFYLIGVLAGALMLVSVSFLTAQDNQHHRNTLAVPRPGNIQIVTCRDGSIYIGRITEVAKDSIIFVTEHGTLTIPTVDILKVREAPEKSVNDGTCWFPDPNRTRLFFAPTGRMLEKGDWYFADYYLFWLFN